MNRTFKPSQVQKHTRLKINNILALPTLLYGRDTWAIRVHDKSRMSAEIQFMRMAKYMWKDYNANVDILSEIKINLVLKRNLKLQK
jgi:hypothetical protein